MRTLMATLTEHNRNRGQKVKKADSLLTRPPPLPSPHACTHTHTTNSTVVHCALLSQYQLEKHIMNHNFKFNLRKAIGLEAFGMCKVSQGSVRDTI